MELFLLKKMHIFVTSDIHKQIDDNSIKNNFTNDEVGMTFDDFFGFCSALI